MSGPWLFVRPRRIRRGAALTLVFASVLATGAATGTWEAEQEQGTAGRRIAARTVAEARAEVRARGGAPAPADRAAVEAAADQAIQDGKSGSQAAAEVVSRSGDRWSTVYTAREYEGFQRELDGEYVGVGLWVRRGADGRVEVARVQPGSPAARSGIRAGDGLRSIDGKAAQGSPVTEIVSRLRGDARGPAARGARAGSPVDLGLERGKRTWTATLHRARLRTENVTVDRPEGERGLTRIKIDAFAKGTGHEVRRAVRDAARAGARSGSYSGVLLDLRGNTGGLVTEAVSAASAFLDGGLVATYDIHGSQRALYAEDGGNTQIPLVVLVDGGTMSAAELLAGALQDRGRAVLVGSQTFGKGSVQMPSELPDGSVAELTVGHYRTPSGRGVDGRGITPDLVAEDGAEGRARTVLSGLGGGA